MLPRRSLAALSARYAASIRGARVREQRGWPHVQRVPFDADDVMLALIGTSRSAAGVAGRCMLATVAGRRAGV
jgi:hypothetical protein